MPSRRAHPFCPRGIARAFERAHARRVRGGLLAALLLTVVACSAPATAHADFIVSGVAARDEALTQPWKGCGGVTISVAYDGVAQAPTTCNPATGAYSTTVVTAVADKVLAVYFDAPGM